RPKLCTDMGCNLNENLQKRCSGWALQHKLQVLTLFGVVLGIVLVLLLQPGVTNTPTDEDDEEQHPFSVVVVLMDLLRNMVPESFIQACYKQYRTEIVLVEVDEDDPSYDPLTNGTEIRLTGGYIAGPNMLGLIIWSFIIGILMMRNGEKSKTTVDAIKSLNEGIKIIVTWMLWYLPIGVLFMIASHVVEVQNWESVTELGKFAGVVILGLFVHSFIVLPLLYLVLVKRNPFVLFKQVSKALLTAAIISSSDCFHIQHWSCRDASNGSCDHALVFDSGGTACKRCLPPGGDGVAPRPQQHSGECAGRLLGVALINHLFEQQLKDLDILTPNIDQDRSINHIRLDFSDLDFKEEFSSLQDPGHLRGLS
ncbi:hypothetical protein ATANTOWER_012324, partial [Ataeniobius toweri]|nr:hypothetical protein [Ataeniobius toweri]